MRYTLKASALTQWPWHVVMSAFGTKIIKQWAGYSVAALSR
jgi:hypothetical protein